MSTTGPSIKAQIEAVAAHIVAAIQDQLAYERQVRLIKHRVTLLDAERHRLFTQLAEEERVKAEPFMRPATEAGAQEMEATGALSDFIDSVRKPVEVEP